MKKIGFIDYYISEWHANNYPIWIKSVNEKLGTDFEVAYAWAEVETSPVDGVTTAQWCKNFGAEKCDTIDEVCEKSDFIIILAPSDPETHLRYAEAVLPYGKRTYIDKTFAQDYETAKKIFELGEKYGTQFFSTSALRYAETFGDISKSENTVITGGGGNFNEYIIHPIEMMVSLGADRIKRVKVEAEGIKRNCSLVAENGLEISIIYSPDLAYTVTVQMEDGSICKKDAAGEFFVTLMCEILRFFEGGKEPFDTRQTLEVMRVRDALIRAEAQCGVWMES